MAKMKVCKQGYVPARWEGEEIALIPCYHPDFKPELLIVEEIEVPGDVKLPKLIDTNDLPLTTLHEICISNDYPLSWFINIQTDIPPFQLNDPLYKALDQFVVFRSSGTTSAQYRRMFIDLIKGGLLDPQMSVSSYLERADDIEIASRNFSHVEPSLYNYNDKLHHLLKSFRAFLEAPQACLPRNKRKTEKYYRRKRKNRPTDEEVTRLFAALKEIDPLHELIARILWWFNREAVDHPDAPAVHLESVLHMETSDIGPDDLAEERAYLPDNAGGNSVRIRAHHLKKSTIIAYYVPGTMYAQLGELANQTNHFLFRNKSGGPIDPRMVRKSFSKACKIAKLRNISPLHLR